MIFSVEHYSCIRWIHRKKQLERVHDDEQELERSEQLEQHGERQGPEHIEP